MFFCRHSAHLRLVLIFIYFIIYQQYKYGATGLVKRELLSLPDPFAMLTVDGKPTTLSSVGLIAQRGTSRRHFVRFRYESFKLCQISLQRTCRAMVYGKFSHFHPCRHDASLHDSIRLTARILSPMLLSTKTTNDVSKPSAPNLTLHNSAN